MHSRAIRAVPLLVAAVGLLVPLVASGGSVWPATLVWTGLVGAVSLAEYGRPSGRRSRIRFTLIALPILILAGWEGGWWLIPAALCQLAIDILGREDPSPSTKI